MILETRLDTSFGFVPCRFWRPREICHPDVLVLKLQTHNVLTKERQTIQLDFCTITVTNLKKQWAADITHSLWMREPPQTWLPNLCRLTCQGQLPAGASSPPTILLFRGVTPHTAKGYSKRTIRHPSWQRVNVNVIITRGNSTHHQVVHLILRKKEK